MPNNNRINGVIKTKTIRKKKKPIPKKKKVKCKANLKRAVDRDKRCLACGSNKDLSAHHICPRSLQGGDEMSNLITLCFDCHRIAEDGTYVDGIRVTAKEFVIDILEYYPEMFSEAIKEMKNEI